MIDITSIDTEKNNLNSYNIDTVSIYEKLKIINNEDKKVAYAVEQCLNELTIFCNKLIDRVQRGGRLFYIGAGTSGRLGVLDASECPPTYGVSNELVQGLIAGGESALVNAKEGSEDDIKSGMQDLLLKNLNNKDCVLGITASGRTPYVKGALTYANSIGAYTGLLSCVKNSELSNDAQIAIEISCGPEVISGSTRMKSGTAQKMVLNMISTTLMISLGKVYKNYMIDVKATNEKLVSRAIQMLVEITGCSFSEAIQLFKESDQNIKLAIIMYINKIDLVSAREALLKANNRLYVAISKEEEY